MKSTEAHTSECSQASATLFSLMPKRLKRRPISPRPPVVGCRLSARSASSDITARRGGAHSPGIRALGLALAALAFCLMSYGSAAATTLYVDNPGDYTVTTDQGAAGLDNGDTVTWNAGAGSEHSPSLVAGLTYGTNAFGTIQDAVNAATAGDTIRVAGGTFSELVQVNKQLFLFGNQVGDDARDGRIGEPETVVNGNTGSSAFSVTADDVVIDGFTVQGQTNVNQFGAGIVLTAGTEGSEVRNNIIQDNVSGIFLANDSASNQAVIERNLIRDNDNPGSTSGTGIYTDQFVSGPTLTNVLIQENLFTGNFTFGLNLQNATSSTVTNNDFEGGNAARLANVDNSSFTNNDFTGFIVSPPSGFQVTALNITSASGSGSNNVTASGNTFTNRRASAVSVSGVSSNLTLTNNTVTQDVSVFAINTLRAMISLTGLAGTNNITNNTITLTGAMPSGAGVNGIAVQGNFTEIVNVSGNTINGGNTDTFTGTNDSHGIGIFGSGLGLPSTPTPVFSTVNVTNNFITNWVDGIAVPNSHNARVTININQNSIAGNPHAGLTASSGTGPINAERNWWGSPTGPTNARNPGGTGDAIIDPSNRVDFTPYLSSGTDTQAGTPGFQPDLTQTGEAVAGTAGSDTLVVTATGPDSGSYSLNGGPAVPFSGVTRFSFVGLGSNDLLRINNPAGGLFAPSGGIIYDGGGQAGDSLENLGGSATAGTYTPGPTADAGVIQHTGGVNQTISFTGLAPATDAVPEGTFTIYATDAANSITLDNGTAAGDGLLRVSIDSFEPIQFANKTNVIVNAYGLPVTGSDLADTITINFTEASTGLSTVTFNGGTGNDVVNLQATAAGVTTNVNTEANDDTLNVGNASNSLDDIQGPVTIDGGAGTGDALNLNDQGESASNTYTVSSTSVARSGGPTINYSAVETLNLNGGSGADTFNVTASPVTTYNIDGNDPTTPPGDVLNYDAEGRRVTGDLTPPNGQITSPGVQPVNFQEIETVNFTNVLPQPWTTTGNSGVTEEESNPARPTYTDFTAAADVGSPAGTYVLRYNIQATDSLLTAGANTRLRVRYRDEGAGSRVTVAIRQAPITGGAATLGTIFDSDNFVSDSGYQTQEILMPAITFDFSNNTYWLEVTLTKANTSNQPGFGSAQINQQ